MLVSKLSYVSDFEATNERETNHVWSWESLVVGDTENPIRGTDINSFLSWVSCTDKTVFFHNLKYDSSYILSELFKRGYEHVEDKKKLSNKKLTTLISDMGIYYSITVQFETGAIVEFLDSYKLISLPVRKIAQAYGLPMSKGEIDYNADRPMGYIPTDEEWDYVHRDVSIVSLALDQLFEQGFEKITQSSNALNDMIETLGGKKKFKRYFPTLEEDIDSFVREGYLGGAAQVNELYKGKEVGRGRVYDVNSEYPWAMREKMLPFGKPVWFDGKYTYDEDYPLFFIKFECMFELKDRHLPTVQAKHIPRFKKDKFLRSSYGRVVTLTLTSIDYEMFFKHYEVTCVKYIGGYKFMASDKILRAYIDKWYSVKEQASIDKNAGLRTIAKDMLNKPSGKFGTKPKVCSKIPYYDEKIRYKLSDIEDRESVYVPLIAYVTAYGRELCISHAQANYDRFLYMDTDSNHYLGDYPVDGLPVDNKKLGYFKHESTFSRAKFLHAKCYVEETITNEKEKSYAIENEEKTEKDYYYNSENELVYLKVTVAGLPSNCHNQVTIENFQVGAEYEGKLRPYMTPNGQILEECNFKIREN